MPALNVTTRDLLEELKRHAGPGAGVTRHARAGAGAGSKRRRE
jgi:hypothetical protein